MNKSFSDYLYENGLDPFEIAFKDDKELANLKSKWMKESGKIVDQVKDAVYEKLSAAKIKVDNDKLVKVVSKMTKGDGQTNKVGSWIYYCINANKTKAESAKSKVSENYQKTIEKYIDSFIQMLVK